MAMAHKRRKIFEPNITELFSATGIMVRVGAEGETPGKLVGLEKLVSGMKS